MDKNLYKKFYDRVTSNHDYFETSLSIKDFVENLHRYRTQRIYDTYQNNISPFSEILSGNESVVFRGYKNGSRRFKIHLNCFADNRSELKFYDENYEEVINGKKINNAYTNKIIKALKEKGINFQETREDEYANLYLFPKDETKLYGFIDELKKQLEGLANDIC